MANLRKLIASIAAEKRAKEAHNAPGPWRSKREAAGLASSAKIEELGAETCVPRPPRIDTAPQPHTPCRISLCLPA